MTSRARLSLVVPLACMLAGSIRAQEPAPAAGRPAAGNRVVRVHDIRNLIAGKRDFRMRRFNREAAGEQAERTATEDDAALRERLLADLRTHLRHLGYPEDVCSFEPAGSEGREAAGFLLVRATPPAQDAVDAFLRVRRARAERIISIDARVYRIRDPRGALPRRLADEPLGQRDAIFFLEPDQADALRRELGAAAAGKDPNIRVLTAPRIHTYDGQRANIVVMDKLSYVADFNLVKVLGRKSQVLDPVVKTLEVGFGIEVKVDLGPDDPPEPSRARVEVTYQNAEVERPIETRKAELGTIQVPKVSSVDLEFTANVTLPGHLLLASRERPDYGIELVLLDFARHDPSELLKKRRARVTGVSPGPLFTTGSPDEKRIYIDAGSRDGVERDMLVRFHRAGKDGQPELLFTGVVETVYADLAVIRCTVRDFRQRVDFDRAGAWWCDWRARPPEKKL